MGPLEIIVEEENGQQAGAGPITSASEATIARAIDGAGTFSFKMPANDPKKALLQNKRIVRIFAQMEDGAWCEVGGGVIDKIDLDPQDAATLVISGGDLLDELGNPIMRGLLLRGADGSPVTDGLAQMMALAPRWALDTQNGQAATTTPVYKEWGGEKLLAALATLAKDTGEHFRLGFGRKLVWLGKAQRSSGLRAVGPVAQADRQLPAHLCNIVDLKPTYASNDLVLRLYPFGNGSSAARTTMYGTTRKAPSGWTLHTGPGLYDNWLEATERMKAGNYPLIEAEQSFSDIGSTATGVTLDATSAADAVFDAGFAWLDKASQVQRSYKVTLAACTRVIMPGETIEIDFDRVDVLTVAETLYILGATLRIDSSGIQTVALDVSTVDRPPRDAVRHLFDALEQQRAMVMHYQPQVTAQRANTATSADTATTAATATEATHAASVTGLTLSDPADVLHSRASASQLGGVKAGAGITIAADGTISTSLLPPSGGGTIGAVPYWDTTGSFATSAITYDAATGRLGVGLGGTSPGALVDVLGSGSSFQATRINATSTSAPNLVLRRAKGSVSSPASVTVGDIIGSLSFNGYEAISVSPNYQMRAGIQGVVDNTVGAGVVPTALLFNTSAVNATPVNRMVVASGGLVGIGLFATGTPLSVTQPSALLHIKGNANIVQQLIQANGTQTANLTEWKDSTAATVLAAMSASGAITASNLAIASGKVLTVSRTLTLTGTDGKTLTVNSSLTLAGTDGKTLTVSNSLTLAGTDGKSLTLTGSLSVAADTTISGGGTLALGGFTLTVAATGTAALLGTAQTFTATQTFNALINGNNALQLTGTANSYVGGNLGVGVTSLKAWASGYKAMEFNGDNGQFGTNGFYGMYENAYYDGANKYGHAGSATRMVMQDSSGNPLVVIDGAPSGSANGAITFQRWIEMTLVSGALKIGFLGVAAVARPAAYTLTGTATRVMPTDPSTAYTGIDNAQAGSVYAKLADLNALRAVVSQLLGVERQHLADMGNTSGYGLLAA